MNEFFLPIGVILLLSYYIYSIQFSARKMPPGPFVLPFGLGTGVYVWRKSRIFNLANYRPWEFYDRLSKDYGNIASASVLGHNVVVLSSYELMTEVANMEEYSSRFAGELYTYPRSFGKELGVVLASSAHLWTEMRKFTMRTLKGFGYGKQHTMHGIVADEANIVADTFEKKIKDNNGIIRIHQTFTVGALNVLWCLVTGTRYAHDDTEAVTLMSKLFHLSKKITFGNPIELVIPFVKRVAPWALPVFRSGDRYETVADWHAFTKRIIDERRETGMYLSDPQTYVDVFLRKIHDTQNDPNSLYTVEQLQTMMEDMMTAGSLTLNDTLNFATLYLILHPEMQARIQKEIDCVIGWTTAPALDDFQKMPFFQAFILETHRCACVFPNPTPRMAPKDWNLHGYHIPKGTIIISNHYGINFSKEIWGDPNTFRPERFINENGEFVSDPRVVIFGFGKRICMGISLVDSIVPIFVATLLQRFNLSVVPGTKAPTTVPEIGATLSPPAFQVLVTLRRNPYIRPAV